MAAAAAPTTEALAPTDFEDSDDLDTLSNAFSGVDLGSSGYVLRPTGSAASQRNVFVTFLMADMLRGVTAKPGIYPEIVNAAQQGRINTFDVPTFLSYFPVSGQPLDGADAVHAIYAPKSKYIPVDFVKTTKCTKQLQITINIHDCITPMIEQLRKMSAVGSAQEDTFLSVFFTGMGDTLRYETIHPASKEPFENPLFVQLRALCMEIVNCNASRASRFRTFRPARMIFVCPACCEEQLVNALGTGPLRDIDFRDVIRIVPIPNSCYLYAGDTEYTTDPILTMLE